MDKTTQKTTSNKEDDPVNKTIEKVSFIKRQSRTGVGEKIGMFENLTTGNDFAGLCSSAVPC